MFTDVRILNLSLNRNKPKFGIFFRQKSEPDQQPILWRLIQNCGYLWEHPIRLDWEFYFKLYDGYGNCSPAILITDFPTTADLQYLSQFGISYTISREGNQRTVHFRRSQENEVTCIVLFKNDRVVAKKAFAAKSSIDFLLENKFSISADPHTREGEAIHPNNMNVSECLVSYSNIKSLELVVLGGAPGPRSTPIRFALNHVQPR